AANNVEMIIQENDGVTPTPVISRAILVYNRGRKEHFADGIVITPSHNPPDSGGFKYNPANGGPADSAITGAIETRANAILAAALQGVERITFGRALVAPTTHRHDYRSTYVADVATVNDLDAIRDAKVRT